jgi:hypothetical protein
MGLEGKACAAAGRGPIPVAQAQKAAGAAARICRRVRVMRVLQIDEEGVPALPVRTNQPLEPETSSILDFQ